LLMPFISGWYSFFEVLLFYGILGVPILINVSIFSKDFTYDDYLRFNNRFKLIAEPRWIISKYAGIGLCWITMLGELLAFFYFNPTIPLLGWGIITYTFIAAFILAALTQSTIFNASTCLYAKITTADGSIEGFIVSKGEDHYLVKTRESDVLLSTGYVKSISNAQLPKQDA